MAKILRKISCAMMVLFSVFLSLRASAHDPKCYTLFSIGQGKVQYLATDRAEERFFRETGEFFKGTYNTDPRSYPYSFGFGCDLYKLWGIIWGAQIAHHEGLKANVVSQVALSGTIGGFDINTDSYEIKRYAEMTGYGLSVTAKTQLYGPLYVTGKVGAIYGKAFMSLASPSIPYGIEITGRAEGVVPLAGAGLLLDVNRNLSIGPGCEFYGRYVRICSLAVHVRF